MVDYAPQYELGEDIDGNFNGSSLKLAVNYTETIAKGLGLQITNPNQTNDNVDVEITGGTANPARFISILDGEINQVKEVLLRGHTKIELSTSIAAGDPISFNASGLARNVTPGTSRIFGFALQSGNIGDLILIYFDGTIAPIATSP